MFNQEEGDSDQRVNCDRVTSLFLVSLVREWLRTSAESIEGALEAPHTFYGGIGGGYDSTLTDSTGAKPVEIPATK